jgi:hypothetical protein
MGPTAANTLASFARRIRVINTTHNLSGPSLGQIWDNEDGLWCGKRTNRFAHLEDQILLCLLTCLVAVFEGNKSVDGLTGQFIGNPHHRSFRYRVCGRYQQVYLREMN